MEYPFPGERTWGQGWGYPLGWTNEVKTLPSRILRTAAGKLGTPVVQEVGIITPLSPFGLDSNQSPRCTLLGKSTLKYLQLIESS